MNRYEVIDSDGTQYVVIANFYNNNNGCLDFTKISKTPDGTKYQTIASFNQWSSVIWLSEVE